MCTCMHVTDVDVDSGLYFPIVGNFHLIFCRESERCALLRAGRRRRGCAYDTPPHGKAHSSVTLAPVSLAI
jgi:hypothetical protein